MDKEKVLKEKILLLVSNSRLTCDSAFKLADEAECSPAVVGKAANELQVKIVNCQLGCF